MGAIEYYTHDDYKNWKGEWELINGSPISMAPAPIIKHQELAYKIAMLLGIEIEKCDNCEVLGEEDWKISDDTVVRPDVVLICDEPNEEYITKAPEIIIEVISPSTAKKDEKHKFSIYESEKVPYYILIYPNENKAKIYKLEKNKYEKQGDFFNQMYKFENTTCKPEVDFDRLFKKYR